MSLRISIVAFTLAVFTAVLVFFLPNPHGEKSELTISSKLTQLSASEIYRSAKEITLRNPNSDQEGAKAWEDFVSEIERKYPVIVDGDALTFDLSRVPRFDAYEEALEEWHTQIGYFSKIDREQYGLYDEKVLKALVEQGDIIAMQVMSDKNREKYGDPNTAYAAKKEAMENVWRYLQMASLHGSTVALQSSAIQHLNRDPIEAAAMLTAATMEGDVYAKSIIDSYQRVGSLSIEKEDWTLVDARAREILQDLDKQRTELGIVVERSEKPQKPAELEEFENMMEGFFAEYNAFTSSNKDLQINTVNGG